MIGFEGVFVFHLAKFSENPWKTLEYPWNPHGKTWKTLENPWKSLENPRKSVENPCKTLENPWKTLENPCKTHSRKPHRTSGDGKKRGNGLHWVEAGEQGRTGRATWWEKVAVGQNRMGTFWGMITLQK